MARLRPRRARIGLGTAAILSLVLAYAVLAQGPGWNQHAHYSLVRALAHGTPVIDRTRLETGTWYSTGDITFFEGHYYAAKAPGLAFAALPAYLPLHAAGVWSSGDSTRMLWFLGLWTLVLPAGVLLFLVRHVADRLQPGSGTAVAVTLGAATLVLPFSTMFFAHVLSTTLGFAAFAVLWHERQGGAARPRLLAAAGLLAGLATTVEYPLALLALILGLYAVSRSPLFTRGLAYAVGAAAGVLPLLLYQWWAFGSPTHFAYTDVVGGYNRTGVLGVNAPSFRTAMELLFSNIGLLRLSPVLALGGAGALLLYRRGRRPEALVLAAVPLAYLVYNAGYETPFGGNSPGPRFLIAVVPFLALGLAPLLAARPLTVLALAAPSAILMVCVTVTHPMEGVDGGWFERFGDGDFSATVLAFSDRLRLDDLRLPSSAHWYPLLVFLVPVAFALGAGYVGRPEAGRSRDDALTGIACLAGWLVLYRQAPRLLDGGSVGEHWGPLVVLLVAAAVGALALALPRVYRARPSPVGSSPDPGDHRHAAGGADPPTQNQGAAT